MSTDALDEARRSSHDATPAPAHGQDRGALDTFGRLEVDLHLELQVISTPVAELAAMRPGFVLELPMPASEACVDLVINGQVHGRAQLVVVGDRIGARILELNHEK